jgi:hypothetical protein
VGGRAGGWVGVICIYLRTHTHSQLHSQRDAHAWRLMSLSDYVPQTFLLSVAADKLQVCVCVCVSVCVCVC